MFKVGDRVVVVKNLLGGPDTFKGQRGVVNELSDEHFGIGVRTESYGVASFYPEELEFEENYDIMSTPHPDEDSIFLTDGLQDDVAVGEDVVSHPSHYTSHPSGVECIEITKHYNFTIGSAMKYLWRAGLKDEDTEIQDLRKAIQFIQFEIERLGGTVG